MRWKQFLTPVNTIDTDHGKKLIKESAVEELTVLDVRQPAEYAKGHLPGAKLIPLPQLMDKLDSLDPHKKTLVY